MSLVSIRLALVTAAVVSLVACGNDYTRVEGDAPGTEEKLPPVVPPRDPGSNSDAGGPLHEVLSAPNPANSAAGDSVLRDTTMP